MKFIPVISIILFLMAICEPGLAQATVKEKAEAFLEDQKYKKVIEIFETTDELNGLEREVLLGRAWLGLQDYGKAIESFERAAEAAPENADYHYWLGTAYVEAINAESNFFKKGRYAFSAKSTLQKAVELDPSHEKARVRLANYYMNAPKIAGGSISKAKEQANELTGYNENLGAQLMASIHLNQKEFDEAEKVYVSLLENKGHDHKIYYLLAVIKLETGDLEKALEYCRKSISEYPEYLMGYYQHAKTAAEANMEVDEGIQNALKYIRAENKEDLPGDHWAYYRLGLLYKLKGWKEEAREAFEKGLEISPGHDDIKLALKEL